MEETLQQRKGKKRQEKRREEIEQQKWGFKTTPQHTHTIAILCN
jgi:hypothetical protein